MHLEDKVMLGVIGTVGAAFVFYVSCIGGVWGSRGVKTDFTSQYHGKPAIVQHEDVRWGPDKHWILLDNRDVIYRGTIISDDMKKITVGPAVPGDFSVRDYQ